MKLPIPTINVFDTLARWGNVLNSWNWPEDMPGKPDGFDQLTNYNYDNSNDTTTKYYYIMDLVGQIKEKIGQKEFLRWHWLNNMGKENWEFDEYWSQRENG